MNCYKQNLHTHSIYCDGKNTPEELVKRAIELGFDTIGFSGHSNTKFDITWHMTQEKNLLYIDEINRLKEKYKPEITVLLGLEYEMFSDRPAEGYDYLIGSSHFVNTKEGEISFDEAAEDVKAIIDKYFDGQGINLAKEYYRQLAHLFEYGDFDIVVANLPYVDTKWDWLDKTTLGFEPEIALYAENEGLQLIFELLEQAKGRTKYVILEADPCQHVKIENFARQRGFGPVKTEGFIIALKALQV